VGEDGAEEPAFYSRAHAGHGALGGVAAPWSRTTSVAADGLDVEDQPGEVNGALTLEQVLAPDFGPGAAGSPFPPSKNLGLSLGELVRGRPGPGIRSPGDGEPLRSYVPDVPRRQNHRRGLLLRGHCVSGATHQCSLSLGRFCICGWPSTPTSRML